MIVRDAFSSAVVVWRRLRPFVFQPWQFRRLLRQVQTSLKTGGVRGLVHRLREQTFATSDYRRWVQAYDALTEADRAAIRRHIARLAYKPLISVVMPTYNTPERWLRLAIESVRKQLYPHWQLCIADDASSQPQVRRVLEEYRSQDVRITVAWRERNEHISAASNSALALVHGEFIALLDHDDELSELALYLVAVALNAHPETDVLYSDEDKIDDSGWRYDPYFKPDWNPELFVGQNFLSHLGVYRAARVKEVGGFRVGYEGSQDWDLAMRIIEHIPTSRIHHIPKVLYHWRAVFGSTALAMHQKDYASKAQAKLLADHFQRKGENVELLPVGTSFWRVKYPLPQPAPLVSLVVTSRSQEGSLRRCVESVCRKTDYPSFELIIISDQPADSRTCAFLKDLAGERAVTFVQVAASSNEAMRQNLAVRRAHGTVMGFLDSTLEVIAPDWLTEIVSHALRPEVGAVGAMLYAPDDTILHAGLILDPEDGIGFAYAGKPRGYAGQVGRAWLSQNLSAISTTCLILRRQLFEEVGGFDETIPSYPWRSVDFCLKLKERGYRNVWTPYAELYCYETREKEWRRIADGQEELARLQQRWGALLSCDPAYNPNLAVDRESFTLAFPPRVQGPWVEDT